MTKTKKTKKTKFSLFSWQKKKAAEKPVEAAATTEADEKPVEIDWSQELGI